MKKFFSILLSILFAICLFITLLLSIVRFNLNYSTITKLASELIKPVSAAPAPVDDGLFHPEDRIVSYAAYEIDENAFANFDMSSIDLSNMDINEIVQAYLDNNDIDVDPAFVAEVLASDDVAQMIDTYADEIINYMTGASDELHIDSEQLTKVVNNVIDKYEDTTGEVVDRTGLDEAIAHNVENMLPELTATLDTAKEENAETFTALKIVNTILSVKVFVLAIAVCVVLALIIFLINMNIFVCFKYISIPSIVVGLILFIAAIVTNGLIPSILKNLIIAEGLPLAIYDVAITYISKILFQLKVYGIAATLLGVILCVFGFKLGKKTTAAA